MPASGPGDTSGSALEREEERKSVVSCLRQMKEMGQTGHIPPVTGQGFPGQQSPQGEQQMGSLS